MRKKIVILVMNQKGGVGKSTIATNLAGEFSKQCKTLLVDADPQHSALDFGKARQNELGEENKLLVVGKDYNQMAGKAVRDDLRMLREDYDVVVLDSPAKADVTAKSLAIVSDLVIIPIIPGYFDVWAMERTKEDILGAIEATDGRLKARLILNRRDDRTGLSKDALEVLTKMEIPLMKASFGNRTVYGHSGGGLTVVEMKENVKAVEEMQNFIAEVQTILKLKGATKKIYA